MKIYCCECKKEIDARLTNGEEIYPHRKDLYNIPFWKCDVCKNYVGCHHQSKGNPTQPLGCIVNKQIKKLRISIHSNLDPKWKQFGNKKRKELYQKISVHIGWKYHTANIRTIEEGEQILQFVKSL